MLSSFFFETRYHVAQSSLELLALLLLAPKCWCYRCEPPHLGLRYLKNTVRTTGSCGDGSVKCLWHRNQDLSLDPQCLCREAGTTRGHML